MNENSPSLTVKEWLRRATRLLKDAGIPSATLDAELLLSHTLREPRIWLHAHPEAELDIRTQEIAQARLDLRLDRVPVAYIIGHKDFYGHAFRVTTATLIPRPESESVIELLKKTFSAYKNRTNETPLRLVDVGTGSGNLGVTAKLLFPAF
ncbi:peptide chain release factor N(5)-glutamine methyltransferase, partial [Candidatus Saccharibacteria bacterium]|nr:peptide chain release factor N(5)-glutamine methyltransferase [Candidatus Saccharibacteria bacterium]